MDDGAIEIGYTTSLVQGYSTKADSYKLSACTGKVQELSQKGIIRDVGGFSGAVYECTHTKYAGYIYGTYRLLLMTSNKKGNASFINSSLVYTCSLFSNLN